MRRKTYGTLAAATALSLLGSGLAVADNVSNTLDDSVDTSVETTSVAVAGTRTVNFKIDETNEDGKSGCNISGSADAHLTVDVLSSDAAKATVSPASLKFTSCGDVLSVVVTGVEAGSSTISLRETSRKTKDNSTFNLAPAAFTTNVTAASSSVVPPTVGYTLDPIQADGDNGWFKSSVSLTWNVTGTSPTKTGCVNQTIAADQAKTIYSCSADNSAGSASDSVQIGRDATNPTLAAPVAADVTGTAGDNGWYTSNVDVAFHGSDATSGLVGLADRTVTLSTDGANQTANSPAYSDNAGNTTAAGNRSVTDIKVDKTGPTDVAFSSTLSGSYPFGTVPAAPTSCSATDSTSGVVSCAISGYKTTVGSHKMIATATNGAGLTSTAEMSYTVAAYTTKGFYSPVDMGTTVNTVKNGSTVPLKFEVFAGATELIATDIASIRYASVTCDGSAAKDEIETLASGSTALRYDSAAPGQYIYNWKTPTSLGCYRATVYLNDLKDAASPLSGTTISALFQLR